MTTVPRARSSLSVLCLTALGVVYGDIGTSPLYAVRECFSGVHGVAVTEANVLGVLSLIFWTLVILVTLKYHVYVLRADNKGEGGILAMMALARGAALGPRAQKVILALGLFGAALLYGDGMLTPAISVLSAVEGLEVATPLFTPYVILITVVILIGLFSFQRFGTNKVGLLFGPVILLWFLLLAVAGAASIAREPSVLRAFHPGHAAAFLLHNGAAGPLVLGAVFLVATGGEALYADLGHFNERAIQIDWFCVAAPALLLNYLGQGALLLRSPGSVDNPFYRLFPEWALYPAVLAATAATVIASQAVISGVYSLSRQAMQMGFLVRLRIVHTSSREQGQIYIPAVNWILLLATASLVVGFRRSTNLASAYGIAISVTMVITTLLAFIVSRHVWRWRLPAALAVTGAFLAADLAFLGANSAKIADGGWLPLAAAVAVVAVFTTWQKGREILAGLQREGSLPLSQLISESGSSSIVRVPGTAVFLCGVPDRTPSALLHNLKHNKILHAQNLFLTVLTEDVPRVPLSERCAVRPLGAEFHEVLIRYGFMEDPDIPEVLVRMEADGFRFAAGARRVTYILSDNTIVDAGLGRLSPWRLALFSFLTRCALRPTHFFRLPDNQVIEIGRLVQM
ncbi:MAG: potassium transporter Kup [Elusimicrobia bacterium GWA2_69_24]|nr:MAG: potassium transporter Kup [Elusimicrobia bacterium GWA2_69_24]HBL16593.1 potassium transporter Kup [Elusimicrobiota bacterium]